MTTVRDQDFVPYHRWAADWIWGPGEDGGENLFRHFRTTCQLDAVPARAVARVSADTRYVLWVNGAEVGRGPALSMPWWQYYDELDVAPYLLAGENTIAVLVYHLGTLPDTRPGLLLELEADGAIAAASSAAWRTTPGVMWARETFYFRMNWLAPFQEQCNLGREPVGWTRHGFDDGGWQNAASLGRPPEAGPWAKLVPRDIPLLTHAVHHPAALVCVEECQAILHRTAPRDLAVGLSLPGRPIELAVAQDVEALLAGTGPATLCCSNAHLDGVYDGIHDPCLTLDFGAQRNAYVELEVEAPAGARIDVGLAERLTDGRFVNSVEGQFAAAVTFLEGRQTWRMFNWYGHRYVRLRLRHCHEPLRLLAVRQISTDYPFADRGRFESSDERLNAIWQISEATTRICCNEYITDTPWREQGQWLGDVAAVTLGSIYCAYGDTALAGKFLRQCAESQFATGLISPMTNLPSTNWRWVLPDYSLWWVRAVWEHYLYTGEQRWVHQLWPQVLKLLHTWVDWLDEHGQLDRLPYHRFVDWAHVDKRGESAAINAIFYGALEAIAHLAELKSDQYTRRLVSQVRDQLAGSFDARYWHAERGCYADANVDGALSDRISEQTNAVALRFGLASPDRVAEIVANVYEQPSGEVVRAEPFFMWQVLQALDIAGRFDLALALVRERWGWMLDRGQTTCSEEWGRWGTWRSGQFTPLMRTESHAWSACPVQFLTKTLLGVEILEPGCRRLRLDASRLAALAPVAVSWPMPLGDLVVACDEGGLRVSAPDSVEILGV